MSPTFLLHTVPDTNFLTPANSNHLILELEDVKGLGVGGAGKELPARWEGKAEHSNKFQNGKL